MRKIKIIGLTGQSGAGKSTVSKRFEELGAIVINADLLVRELYQRNSVCVKTLSSVFGEKILTPSGEINRRTLAQIAFSSRENTETLNSIVHPFVTDLFIKKLKKAEISGATLSVYDAPQLFESGFDVMCDCIISVVADEEIRLDRICKRDKISPQLAKARFNAQHSDKFFRENSDYTLENNGNLDVFLHSLDDLIDDLRKQR